MSAYQFKAVVEDGVIRVPEEYAGRLTSKIRVLVMPDNKKATSKAALFPDLHLDTRGYKFDRDEANAR